jgi:hypothetical protein
LRKLAAIGWILLICSFSGLAFGQETPVKILLEDILKAPDKYNGKLVETRGFLLLEFENSALYVNEKWQRTRGIWITPAFAEMHIRREELNRHYVVVTGIFDANDHGHLGQFKGKLTIEKFRVQGDGKSPQ